MQCLSAYLGLFQKRKRRMLRGKTICSCWIATALVRLLREDVIAKTRELLELYPKGAETLQEAFVVVGSIAVTLAGAFGLVAVFTKVANKPLSAIGKSLGMNEVGAAGLVASLANNIAMFQMLKIWTNVVRS